MQTKTQNPAIRAIFFDAVGTLIHPEPPAVLVYAAVGRRHGSRLAAAEVTRRFVDAFARAEALDVAHGLQTSEERELRRWQHIVGAVLDDVADGAGCFAELYHHFRLPTAWRCAADVGALLDELNARGYRLGVASNYDHRLHAVLDGLPEVRLLRERIVSAEVGWRKPAAGFFAAILARTGLPAEQILLVGDDLVNDYEGARACGIPAVLLDARGRHADIPERITRLGEVLDLLRR